MPSRLMALDDGVDINLDRTIVVVGRHPSCDARLDSLRVSRHHCCMTHEGSEIFVRDLGSTNGIRINGQRVENGRMRPGDELSIAHIRYRVENGQAHEPREVEAQGASVVVRCAGEDRDASASFHLLEVLKTPARNGDENALAAAVRKLLPGDVADKCHIQVIIQMVGEPDSENQEVPPGLPDHASENVAECHSESFH